MKLKEIKIGDILNYVDEPNWNIIFKVTEKIDDDFDQYYRGVRGIVLTSCNTDRFKNNFKPGNSIVLRKQDLKHLTKL